jgi:integrase
MLYDAGVDLKTAQKWMGHADADVTMKIYTHLSAEREKSASEALENAAKMLYGVQNGVQDE